jgi:hypothetical protein
MEQPGVRGNHNQEPFFPDAGAKVHVAESHWEALVEAAQFEEMPAP